MTSDKKSLQGIQLACPRLGKRMEYAVPLWSWSLSPLTVGLDMLLSFWFGSTSATWEWLGCLWEINQDLGENPNNAPLRETKKAIETSLRTERKIKTKGQGRIKRKSSLSSPPACCYDPVARWAATEISPQGYLLAKDQNTDYTFLAAFSLFSSIQIQTQHIYLDLGLNWTFLFWIQFFFFFFLSNPKLN